MYPNLMFFVVILGVSACVELPAQDPVLRPKPPSADSCGAGDLQSLVGQRAKVLETMRFGNVTRVIRPNMGVTMDYSDSRLNIEINDRETITRVNCG